MMENYLVKKYLYVIPHNMFYIDNFSIILRWRYLNTRIFEIKYLKQKNHTNYLIYLKFHIQKLS